MSDPAEAPVAPHPDHAHWRRGNITDRLFIIAVLIKGLDGLIGIGGGIALFFVHPAMLNHVLAWLITYDLSRDAHHLIADALVHFVAGLDANKLAFAAGYLLAHGALKTFLVAMLLVGRRWSYPAGIVFLAVFVLYTLHRLTLHWSWILLAFALFDTLTIFLVAREWQAQRAKGAA